MRIALLVCFFCIGLSFSSPLAFADSSLVPGVGVPLVEGATFVQEKQSANGYVRTYRTQLAVADAITFYQDYFAQNGYEVLAGEEAGCYSVSVRKGSTVFSVRIFQEGQDTRLQFIW